MKRAALLLAIAAAALPGVASADFLYNAIPPDRMPYVFVIMDNSFSMIQSDHLPPALPPYGWKVAGVEPLSRLDAAKESLRAVLDEVEGVGVGFIHFYPNGRYVDLNGVNGSNPSLPAYNPLMAGADLAHSELGRSCGACLITYPDGVNDRTRILAELDVMQAETDTALGISLNFAEKMIKRVASGYTLGGAGASTPPTETPDTNGATDNDETTADAQLSCRRYFVVLMTDGEDTCSDVAPLAGAWDPIAGRVVGDASCATAPAGAVPACAVRAGHVATLNALNALRDVNLGGGQRKMVATFIIGFGKATDLSFAATMKAYASAGRTSYNATTKTFTCMLPNGSFGDAPQPACAAGPSDGALMASNQPELRAAFKLAFEAALAGEFVGSSPIIASVPQETTEFDRVSRNFLVYGSFRMPHSKGALYGIRLYKETGAATNVFEFTDLRDAPTGDLDLANCGTPATNACVFEAGQMLTTRVSGGASDRRIFTAEVAGVAHTDNGETGSTYELKPTPVVILAPSDAGADLDRGIPVGTWNAFMTTAFPSPLSASVDPASVLDDLPAGLRAQAGANFTTIGDKLHTFYVDASSGPFHRGLSKWLHGLPAPASEPSPADVTTWDRQGRNWALGDVLHSSVAIVGPPGGALAAAGYSDFRNTLVDRPPMIYVGANDGMIHAFYAGPDINNLRNSLAARWDAGEEAYAFLPPSQFANTAYNVLLGNKRFDSQDLSCRATDVLMDASAYASRTCTAAGCSCGAGATGALCGWRTVLVCGQGWGGNWYTALDVTWANHDTVGWQPTPRPLWEFTNFTPDGGTKEFQGLGRTWSVPGAGKIRLEPGANGGLRSIAVFGNGYNASQRSCDELKNAGKCEESKTTWNAAWAALNLPYQASAGSLFPRYGEGTDGDDGNVWALDLARGIPLHKFTQEKLGAVVSNVPVFDADGDLLADAAYPAGWGIGDRTEVGRVVLTKGFDAGNPSWSRVSDWGICDHKKGPLDESGSKPITVSPAVFRHPYIRNKAFLFAGTGVEQEAGQQHPDLERFAAGNDWKFYGITFTEDGSLSSCENGDKICPGGGSTEKFDIGQDNPLERLVGAPTLLRQAGGQDWLLFATLTPPATFCGSPTTYLWCMDVTNTAACLKCGDLDGDGDVDQSAEIPGAPTSPAVADGQIYTVGGEGVSRTTPGGTGATGGSNAADNGGNNQSGGDAPVGGSGAGPNGNRSRFLPVSFREIF